MELNQVERGPRRFPGRAAPAQARVAGVEVERGVGGEMGKTRLDLGDPRWLPGRGLHQICFRGRS